MVCQLALRLRYSIRSLADGIVYSWYDPQSPVIRFGGSSDLVGYRISACHAHCRSTSPAKLGMLPPREIYEVRHEASDTNAVRYEWSELGSISSEQCPQNIKSGVPLLVGQPAETHVET